MSFLFFTDTPAYRAALSQLAAAIVEHYLEEVYEELAGDERGATIARDLCTTIAEEFPDFHAQLVALTEKAEAGR